MAKKAYFGQIGKLKKDKIEEYEELHANTWPHIRQLIRDCNLVNYSIFRYEDMVFSYYEYIGDNYEADMAKMASDEINQKWWDCTHPCFENKVYGDADYYFDMKQIFYNE